MTEFLAKIFKRKYETSLRPSGPNFKSRQERPGKSYNLQKAINEQLLEKNPFLRCPLRPMWSAVIIEDMMVEYQRRMVKGTDMDSRQRGHGSGRQILY